MKHNKAVIGALLACMLACAYSNEYNPPEWMFREVVAQIEYGAIVMPAGDSAGLLADLEVSPSIAGQAFTITVPTYAQSLQVFDRSGRVVNQPDARRGKLLWQGTDEHGRQLSEGVYFIMTTGGDRTEVKKVLLLR